MNGDDVRKIREAIGQKIGKRLGQQPFGIGFGLSRRNYNAEDTIRRWESIGPTPPAALALDYMRQGLETTLPEFLTARDGVGDLYIVRLHYPRFVAKVADLDNEGAGIAWIDSPGQFCDEAEADDLARKAFRNAPIP